MKQKGTAKVSMEGHPQKTNTRRRRGRKPAPPDRLPEPILIAARRPDSPLPKTQRRLVAASAKPKRARGEDLSPADDAEVVDAVPTPRRRDVRIVQAQPKQETKDQLRTRLLDRLVNSEGRGAITRAADDLRASAFDFPKEQAVQLQLLEHENEKRVQEAVFIMAELLQRESPIKRPILEQRLRRLELYAEDPITRDAASALRRSMRVHHGMN